MSRNEFAILLLNGKLDARIYTVKVLVEGVHQVQGECSACVVYISSPKMCRGVESIRAFCSISSMTRLATTIDTGDPFAVL